MVIDKINDMKVKLSSKVTLRKAGKTKMDSEISIRAVNSAKRKRVEEAMVLRTKPEANRWLHLTPRIAALGTDVFERGPVMIKKI